MSQIQPVSWPDRLLRACLAVLFAAIALYAAVRLVGAVWVELLIGIIVLALVSGGVWLGLRSRSRW